MEQAAINGKWDESDEMPWKAKAERAAIPSLGQHDIESKGRGQSQHHHHRSRSTINGPHGTRCPARPQA